MIITIDKMLILESFDKLEEVETKDLKTIKEFNKASTPVDRLGYSSDDSNAISKTSGKNYLKNVSKRMNFKSSNEPADKPVSMKLLKKPVSLNNIRPSKKIA